MITITLQFENATQLAVFSAALDRVYAQINPVEETPVENKPAKKSKSATAAPAAEPAATDASPAPTPSEPAVTLEQVRAKLGALTQGGKRAEVKALLESFGVGKLTDLDKAQYAAVLAAAEAL